MSEEHDDFQQLIVSMLQKEIIPEFQAVRTGAVVGFKFQSVLEGAVKTLVRGLSLQQELTTKHKLCWSLVAACCSKVNIARENLDWLCNHGSVLEMGGHIYTVYCSIRMLTEDQCNIIEQLPEEVAYHPNEDIKRYTVIMCKVNQEIFAVIVLARVL